jgi:hypothetical protein
MEDDTQNGQSMNSGLDLPGDAEGSSRFDEDRDLLREADLLMKDRSGFKIVNEEITVDLPDAQEPRLANAPAALGPNQPVRVEPERPLPPPAPSQRQPRAAPTVDPALQKEARRQIDQLIQQYQTDAAAISTTSRPATSAAPNEPRPIKKPVTPPPAVAPTRGIAQTPPPESPTEGPKRGTPIAPIINEIIAALHLTFEDDAQRHRFLHIAQSRLRNVRTSAQTRETLTRPKKVGGMEWDELLAASVTERLDQFVEQGRFTDSKVSVPASAPSVLSNRYRQSIMKKIVEAERSAPSEMNSAGATAVNAQQEVLAQIQKLKEPEAMTESVALGHPSESSPLRVRRDHRDPGRPMLEDIKPGSFSRPVGPVAELQTITVVDFRRLPGGIHDRTQHLLEKFQLLEEDSWTRRSEGINAWKRSPLNQLYVRMGIESMERAVPVQQIIQERTAGQKETLSLEEFNAIADLNKHLRY